MIDIVSTRFQEVYAKWNRRTEIKRNPESNTVRFSIKGKTFIQCIKDVKYMNFYQR